jgi:hypothetical protein
MAAPTQLVKSIESRAAKTHPVAEQTPGSVYSLSVSSLPPDAGLQLLRGFCGGSSCRQPAAKCAPGIICPFECKVSVFANEQQQQLRFDHLSGGYAFAKAHGCIVFCRFYAGDWIENGSERGTALESRNILSETFVCKWTVTRTSISVFQRMKNHTKKSYWSDFVYLIWNINTKIH